MITIFVTFILKMYNVMSLMKDEHPIFPHFLSNAALHLLNPQRILVCRALASSPMHGL